MTSPSRAPMLEADLGPGVRGAFTLRHGGVSPAPWSSMNLGLGVTDEPARVAENRRRVDGWAGAPVTYATQVHGAGVALVARPPADSASAVGEHDALVATSVGVPVAVLVADCVPVLLADPVAGVVAAVHAGRAGVLAGVVPGAVATMVASGAEPARVRAVVGPAVCGRCYEVPPGLQEDVCRVVPAARSTTSWGTTALDLPAAVATQLGAAGVGAVERVDACTVTDERFFSHRRATALGSTTGRFAAVVVRDA
ncbi:peptidoglycan editing factor PgeF [Sanguibacter suaedae]|uniref:Purine nucleoside phosphorylase n=1 Tax=Sanguibacter suaedae TaxID=2795737 RepID=A0A934IB44_9MICO|nr:peptidoglycan editing factor PgeF [Sanguibacter suaedae]MBI9115460.1 peptidoglycan editing factor PgeF [Sanguibacter suaedae]